MEIEHDLRENESWPVLSKELPILSISPSVENFVKDEKSITNENNDKPEKEISKNQINQEKSGIENLAFFSNEETNSGNMITKF